tara:strand:- start:335 stop:526 length:192 start_codon:yes stop_codon:yes gene_type:complete
MPSDKFPDVSKELVDQLEDIVPNRLPDLSWNDRRIWYEAGKRSLVDFLKMKYEDQIKTTIVKD